MLVQVTGYVTGFSTGKDPRCMVDVTSDFDAAYRRKNEVRAEISAEVAGQEGQMIPLSPVPYTSVVFLDPKLLLAPYADRVVVFTVEAPLCLTEADLSRSPAEIFAGASVTEVVATDEEPPAVRIVG